MRHFWVLVLALLPSCGGEQLVGVWREYATGSNGEPTAWTNQIELFEDASCLLQQPGLPCTWVELSDGRVKVTTEGGPLPLVMLWTVSAGLATADLGNAGTRHFVQGSSPSAEEIEAAVHSNSLLLQARKLARAGDGASSVAMFKEAAAMGNSEAAMALGGIFWQGKFVPRDIDVALLYWTDAAENGVRDAHLLVGTVHSEKCEVESAIAAYEKGVAAGDARAKGDLAVILASGHDPNYHDGERALKLAIEALEEDDGTGYKPGYLAGLGMAYARVGRFEEAIEAQTNALRLWKSRGEGTDWRPEARARLQLYQDGLPYQKDECIDHPDSDS